MTTKHTCNNGNGPHFGRKTPGCPRCDELLSGAKPVQWAGSLRRAEEDRTRAAIRAHFADPNHGKPGHRCFPVCTAFDY